MFLTNRCKELQNLTQPEQVKGFIRNLNDNGEFDTDWEKIADIEVTALSSEQQLVKLLKTRYAQLVTLEIPCASENKEELIDKACALLVCLWKLSVIFPHVVAEIREFFDPFYEEDIVKQLYSNEFYVAFKMFQVPNKLVLERERIGRICFRGSDSAPSTVFQQGFIPHGYDRDSLPTVQNILIGGNEFHSDNNKVAAFSTRLEVAARFPLPKSVCVNEESYVYIIWLEEGYPVKRSGCLNYLLHTRGYTPYDKDQLSRYDSTEEIAGVVSKEHVIGCFKISRTVYDPSTTDFPQGNFSLLDYIANPGFVVPDKFAHYDVQKAHDFFKTWVKRESLNFYQKEWRGEEEYTARVFKL